MLLAAILLLMQALSPQRVQQIGGMLMRHCTGCGVNMSCWELLQLHWFQLTLRVSSCRCLLWMARIPLQITVTQPGAPRQQHHRLL